MQVRVFRSTVVVASVAIAAGLSAGTAAASGTHPDTVGNPGSVTLVAAPASIDIISAPRSIGCSSVAIPVSVDRAGAATVAAAATAFRSCALNGVVVTVTQPAAWSGSFRHLDDASGNVAVATLDLGSTLQVASLGCSFSLLGSILGDRTVGPVGHGVTVSVPSLALPASLRPWTLVVSATSGASCPLLGVTVGLQAQIRGSFALSPALSIRG
ncbi:hypothetical protein Q5424_06075 [Conexibacter sp. JD483]|uniref:hypothetical protein n=1 Tax=unclassified Conexibacter TaxID=2627773 RepID=UPI0027214003|nr:MULTISPECIES: hypothetical protein [unclassified Conexibacter]MDO8185150.1 hypothetical protein [Conexibacter sp. CPCC 205706]MDO8196860.1 hypothetical protein [Conexibacter sp. CPCC 205762]MDR9368636.1 hypothetical protein [Conexibacter sp. JD483]